MSDSKRRPPKASGFAAGKHPVRAVSEEGQKRTFGSAPVTSSPATRPPQPTAEPIVETIGDSYIMIPARQIRSWHLKDRTSHELEDDNEFAVLVDEVGAEGIISPITVRPLKKPDADGHYYEEVVGYKRVAAAKIHNIDVPAHVRNLTDIEAARLQKSENSGRSKPSVWSLSQHYDALLSTGMADSQSELAAMLKIDRSQFANYIRIAKNMPDDLVKGIKLHRLGFNTLNSIIALIGTNQGAERNEVVDRIIEVADEINDRPEKAGNVLNRLAAQLSADPRNSTASETGVYRSQKGKAFSVKPGNNKLSLTLHSGALEVVSQDEVTQVISEFLEKKGLTLEKVEKK